MNRDINYIITLLVDSEITLKILAHNNLIGRIIGKGGNTIKRIMQDTDTKITVSSINDINSFNLERIITVKGTIDNMSKAESMISSKLRQSYENDLQAMAVSLIAYCSPFLNTIKHASWNSAVDKENYVGKILKNVEIIIKLVHSHVFQRFINDTIIRGLNLGGFD